MWGVGVNALAIVLGALLGFLFKKFVTDRISKCIEMGLGVCTLILAVKMALNYQSVIIMIGCVVLGGIMGTVLQLENRINRLAQKIQDRFVSNKNSSFAQGLAFTSILYCTGAFAVLGSIEAGMGQGFEILYAKSMLDGFFNITMASIYGIGVLFSAVPVFLYQGAIALFAGQLDFLSQPAVIKDISGVGGVLVAMISLNVMRIKTIPVGDYLPAIFLVMVVAPLWYL